MDLTSFLFILLVLSYAMLRTRTIPIFQNGDHNPQCRSVNPYFRCGLVYVPPSSLTTDYIIWKVGCRHCSSGDMGCKKAQMDILVGISRFSHRKSYKSYDSELHLNAASASELSQSSAFRCWETVRVCSD